MLYTSSLSPFCSVVQVFLKYEGFDFKSVEVDPWKKTVLQKIAGPSSTAVLPYMVFSDGKAVWKAQEIIDAVQSLRGPGKSGHFSNSMKNQCMRINERVLPLVALNRHLSWTSTHETVKFVSQGFFCCFLEADLS